MGGGGAAHRAAWMDTGVIPGADEVEVSLFGPGYGECVVVHLGCGEWLVVDSCLNDEGRPVALAYLESLGVDVAVAVKRVVVSHWHDDHIRGLARVVDAARSAEVVFSIALGDTELVVLTEMRQVSGATTSGVNEMRDVLRLLEKRQQQPIWAGQDRRVFARAAGTAPAVEVWTLSPVDSRFTETLQVFREAQTASSAIRVQSLRPNETAIALHVAVGERVLLLGSDLEEVHGDWTSVVSSTTRPQASAGLYKVAHHGSVTAECAGVWKTLLSPQPLCLVSPFLKGRTELPQRVDIRRLMTAAGRLYRTSSGPVPAAGRTGAKAKAIARAVRRITAMPPCGHIQVRASAADASAAWRVEVDASAHLVELGAA